MNSYDVVVVGAGPAGIASSIELADAGWSVLLIDKSSFPREKVCGGFIGPENKELLARYDILDQLTSQAKKVTHILLSAPNGETIHVPLKYKGREDYGLGLSRKQLDQALLGHAQKKGVVFMDRTVIGNFVYNQRRYKINLKRTSFLQDEEIVCTHMIYANGAGVQAKGSGHRLFGVAGLFDLCHGIDSNVIMHFIDQGHVGINRFEQNNINVCYVIKESLFKKCAGSFDLIWENFMQSNPRLRQQMQSSKLLNKWKGTFIDMDRPPRFFDGNAFYVGDACSLIHPVAGGGISLALSAGILLGTLMGKYQPKNLPDFQVAREYEILWKKNFQGAIVASRMLGALGHHAGIANGVIKLLKIRQGTVNNFFDSVHQTFAFPLSRRTHGFNKNS